jgi:TonB family protein
MRRAAPALLLLPLLMSAARADTAGPPPCDKPPMTAPVPLSTHAPPPELYPPLSAMMGETGNTVVHYVVKEDGSVGEATVGSSSGSLRLDDAATAFVRGFTFKPATLDGKPAACSRFIKINWKLRTSGMPDYAADNLPTLYPDKNDFPAGALDHEEKGTAIAFVLLTETGAIDRVFLMVPAPFFDLNAATIVYLAKQKFAPASMNGTPIRTTIVVRVVWSPSGKPPPPAPTPAPPPGSQESGEAPQPH